jgi:phosphatidylserine/phosphatidylglycerophosphate/cardiolipin synthase-like enzyme
MNFQFIIISNILFNLFFSPLVVAEWHSSPKSDSKLNVCFSPQGKCENLVVQAINKAEKSIYIQAYSFTSIPIADALIEASKKGVEIKVVLDRSQKGEKFSQGPKLIDHKIPVYIQKSSGIAHNKIMIIDQQNVLTGSYNWTQSANKRNSENLMLIKDSDIAKIYLGNWQRCMEHASPCLQLSDFYARKKRARKLDISIG